MLCYSAKMNVYVIIHKYLFEVKSLLNINLSVVCVCFYQKKGLTEGVELFATDKNTFSGLDVFLSVKY